MQSCYTQNIVSGLVAMESSSIFHDDPNSHTVDWVRAFIFVSPDGIDSSYSKSGLYIYDLPLDQILPFRDSIGEKVIEEWNRYFRKPSLADVLKGMDNGCMELFKRKKDQVSRSGFRKGHYEFKKGEFALIYYTIEFEVLEVFPQEIELMDFGQKKLAYRLIDSKIYLIKKINSIVPCDCKTVGQFYSHGSK